MLTDSRDDGVYKSVTVYLFAYSSKKLSVEEETRTNSEISIRSKETVYGLDFFLLMAFVVARYYCNAERKTWIKERSSDWWERIVPQFNSEEWRENF